MCECFSWPSYSVSSPSISGHVSFAYYPSMSLVVAHDTLIQYVIDTALSSHEFSVLVGDVSGYPSLQYSYIPRLMYHRQLSV